MNIFPITQPELSTSAKNQTVYRDIAWNFKTNSPIWRGGNPYIVSGADAVASWEYHALQIPRYRFEIYSWNYGNEFEELIGTTYSDELKKAEAKRYVKECLLVNSHITDADNIQVDYDNGKIKISCILKTEFGEVRIDV